MKTKKIAPYLLSLIIAVITYVVFSPSLKCGFTNWDDNDYVRENPIIVSEHFQTKKFFTTKILGNYHPVTTFTLACNYQLSKLNARAYHSWNVWFHVFNTILLFAFIFLLTDRSLLMAAVVSILFGIHPMHVESVTWISERKDVLYVMFFLAGLITYLRFSETRKTIWYVATLLLFVLSCLSKGMAVVFPVILLLVDYYRNIKMERRVWVEKIPFFLLSLAIGIVAIKLQGKSLGLTLVFTLVERISFASYGAMMYIIKLLAPFNLSSFYPYPPQENIPFIFYLCPFILLGLVTLVFFFLRKEKPIVFGLLFYFVSIALLLQLVSVGSTIMADRYSYLCSIGLFFVIAHILNQAWTQPDSVLAKFKYPLAVLIFAGVIIFCYRTDARIRVWTSSETLWSNVIETYPMAIAYESRGFYYLKEKLDHKNAIIDFSRAIQVDSSYSSAYYNIGWIYNEQHKDSLALEYFSQAIAVNNKYLKAYNNRGAVYAKLGHDSLALSDYNAALKLDSAYAPLYSNLGKLYSQYNYMRQAALGYLNKALELDSTYVPAYYNRASFYVDMGNNSQALADLNKALELDSNYYYAYNDRGSLYYKQGLYDLAWDDYNKALTLDSTYAKPYSNRGLLFFRQQKIEEALKDFTRAVELDPTFAEPIYNLGVLFNGIGKYQQAADCFTRFLIIKPNEAQGYNARGLCYLSLNNYRAALFDFSMAISLNPGISAYWLSRSKAHKALGQNSEANADALKAHELERQ